MIRECLIINYEWILTNISSRKYPIPEQKYFHENERFHFASSFIKGVHDKNIF